MPGNLTGNQRVILRKHMLVVVAGCAVNGEHSAGIAYAQNTLPGKLPVDIAGQRRQEGKLFHMGLTV